MMFAPKIQVQRFNQLDPGDLFIFDFDGILVVALKAVDQMQDGDEVIVPLSLELPPEHGVAQFLSSQSCSVISFGKEYSVSLSPLNTGWMFQPPSPSTPALALKGNELFVRANSSGQAGKFSACLVKLDDGSVHYSWPDSKVAYSINWKILVEMTLPLLFNPD
jgi:hypothetical protein